MRNEIRVRNVLYKGSKEMCREIASYFSTEDKSISIIIQKGFIDDILKNVDFDIFDTIDCDKEVKELKCNEYIIIEKFINEDNDLCLIVETLMGENDFKIVEDDYIFVSGRLHNKILENKISFLKELFIFDYEEYDETVSDFEFDIKRQKVFTLLNKIINNKKEEEYLDEDNEEFTIDDLCSYVLVNKLDNCKTMKEEIEVLKDLYEVGFDDGYNKAIQDDVEEKMDYLNGDFEE